MSSHHIVSLGASFASGPGIKPQVDLRSMRSGNNYPSLLARKLGADTKLTDLTVGGATTRHLLSESKDKHHPPQLELFPDPGDDVDIVTITVGSNDFGYIGKMAADSSSLFPSSMVSIPDPPPTIDEVSDTLIAVVDEVRRRAPKARLFLVEYQTVLGDDIEPGKDVDFTADQIDEFRGISDKIQAMYERTAQARPWIELVPIRSLSRNHGIESDNPWMEGFKWSRLLRGKAPFHPNIEGMEAVANELHGRVIAGVTEGKERGK